MLRWTVMDGGAELTVRRGAEEVTLPFSGRFVIGSASDADVVLPDVEPVHARIVSSDEGPLLLVASQRADGLPVLVNGDRVVRGTPLQTGDELRLGDVCIVFRAPGRRPATGLLTRAAPAQVASPPRSIEDSQQFSWFESGGLLQRSLRTLYEASKLFTSSAGETVLLERTLDLSMEGLLADGGAVVGRSGADELVELCARRSRPGPRLSEEELARAARGGTSSAFQTTDGSSYLVVPVMRPGARPEGALWFLRHPGKPDFAREELELATALGRQLAAGLEDARLVKGLRQRTADFERLQRRLEAILTTISEGLALVTWEGLAAPLSPRGQDLLSRVGWTPGGGLGAESPLAALVEAARRGERVERRDVVRGGLVIEVSAARAEPLEAVVLVLRDATEERRRERDHAATERRLQREVLEIGAREQRRIGQDLHDGLCQTLVAVGLLVEGLADRLAERALADEAKAARSIAMHLRDAGDVARDLARGLNPVALEEFGLVAALTELANSTARLTGVPCALESEPILVHDNAVAINLYYIAREAVNNAVKHARPTRLTLSLARSAHHVVLRVEDDGQGLPLASATPRSTGTGLHIMAHRARSIGAELEVRRGQGGRGTVVACTIPLAAVEGSQ